MRLQSSEDIVKKALAASRKGLRLCEVAKKTQHQISYNTMIRALNHLCTKGEVTYILEFCSTKQSLNPNRAPTRQRKRYHLVPAPDLKQQLANPRGQTC